MNSYPSSPFPRCLAFSAPVLNLRRVRGVRVLAAVMLGAFAGAGALAQQSGGSVNVISSYSGPPPQAAQPPPENFAFGPSLGPSGRPPSSDEFSISGTFNYWRSRQSIGPFFLPVLLPVLGATTPPRPVVLAASYPRAFADEPFFMAYGNLAARHLLSAKRAERIARYQSDRFALLAELRGQLSRNQDAPNEARGRALADLAATQTPRLLELEDEAEQIRYDLTHFGVFKTIADDIGDMSPGYDRTESGAAAASLRLLLSAAHFRDGLSPDQRRLLGEMAQETQLIIEPESDASSPANVFFWPAGARIRVPAGLPPATAATFEEFQRRKAALKDELRAALVREDSHTFIIDRTEAYARLAAAQAPRFAELDALADQIRPALAALPDTGTLSVTELPGDLARQVAVMVERKAALQRELYARLNEFRRELANDRVDLVMQESVPALAVKPVTVREAPDRPDRAAVLERVEAANAGFAAQATALNAEMKTVHAALARYQATAPGARPGLTVDQVAVDFLTAYKAREYRNRQRDYAAAVLAPGLSPAQRRLLLTAAHADLLGERLPSAP